MTNYRIYRDMDGAIIRIPVVEPPRFVERDCGHLRPEAHPDGEACPFCVENSEARKYDMLARLREQGSGDNHAAA